MGEVKYEFLAKRSAQLSYENITGLLKDRLIGEIIVTEDQLDTLVGEIDSRFGQALNVRPNN